MTSGSGRLVIRCVIAILTTAISMARWTAPLHNRGSDKSDATASPTAMKPRRRRPSPCFGLKCDRLKSHRSVTPVTSFFRAVVNLADKGS